MLSHISGGPPHQTVEFVATLARARQQRGLTQSALGARLGLPQSHISKIESGRTDLRLSSLIELARQLDLELVLVPRKFLPAIRSIIARPSEGSGSVGEDTTKYLYRLGSR